MKDVPRRKTDNLELAARSSPEYREFIAGLKSKVEAARISASRSVNRELILLYWEIGQGIVQKQQTLGWGDSVVEIVAADLRREFPGMTGFSARNVWDMRRLYFSYTDAEFLSRFVGKVARLKKDPNLRRAVAESLEKNQTSAPNPSKIQFLQHLVAEIPWGHNLLIINKISDPAARLWYLQATARFGWSV